MAGGKAWSGSTMVIMMLTVTLFSSIGLVVVPERARADVGTPDEFGYYWISSTGSPLITYSWIDGETGATEWTGVGDDSSIQVSLGFDFPFYGIDYNSVNISSNGFMSFTSSSTSFSNTAIPGTSAPNALIATCWDDLDPPEGNGAIFYKTETSGSQKRFIVTFSEVQGYHSTPDPNDIFTFQTVLWQNGTILMQYRFVGSATGDANGGSATIGIENQAGTVGCQFSYNTPSLQPDFAIQFVYVPPPTTTTFYSHDFETPWTGSSLEGTPNEWEWGAPSYANGPSSVTSGSKCWGTDLDGDYDANSNYTLVSPLISLPSNYGYIILEFKRWFKFESYDDGGVVKINVSGMPDRVISPIGGYPSTSMSSNFASMTGSTSAFSYYSTDTTTWSTVKFDISAYTGLDVRFKFQVVSDSSSQYAGWYIDDIAVKGGNYELDASVSKVAISSSVAGQPCTITGTVCNVGNVALTGVFAECTVRDSSGTIVLSNTISIGSISIGETVNQTWSFTPSSMGRFNITVKCSVFNDMCSLNDQKSKFADFYFNNDVGVYSLRISRLYISLGQTVYFNATIKNFGLVTQGTIPVNITVRNATNAIVLSNSQSVSLSPGASTLLSWTMIATSYGNHTVIVATALPSDEYAANNVRSSYVLVSPSLRFADDMESGTGAWTHSGTGDVWSCGTPSYADGPSSTPSGNKCWGTNLNGEYPANMNANLTIGGISLANADYGTLSFKHWYDFENHYDGGAVKISTDGSTWHDLVPNGGYPSDSMGSSFEDAVGTTSGYTGTSGDWLDATFDLTPYLGGYVRIRFQAVSDGSIQHAGWYIDDVFVFAGYVNNDVSVRELTAPSNAEVLEQFPIVANISNLGYNTQTNFNVKCEVSNSSGVQYSDIRIIPTLAGWANTTESWSVSLPAQGMYIITVRTLLPIDEFPNNDMKMKCIYIGPTISIPTMINFENSSGEWLAGGSGEWQYGIPNYASGPSSAHSGVSCWGTNLIGNYDNNANATLTSPVFNLTSHAGHFVYLSFYQWFNFENSFDGGIVEISTDIGQSWHAIIPESYYPSSSMSYTFTQTMGVSMAYTGNSGGWQEARFNVTQFLGNVTMFRFHMASDVSTEYAGWYIDDVSIEVIIPPPNAVIDTPSIGFSAIEDTTIDFAGHAFGGSGTYVAYQWSSNVDGVLSDQASFSISNLTYGYHTITFGVMDTNNIWSINATIQIIITATPPIANIISVTPNPGNTNQEVIFRGNGTDPKGRALTQYYWRSDVDGGLSNYREFTHTFTAPGTRTIFFKVMNSAGAWSPEVSIVLVVNLNNPPIINFTYPSQVYQMYENSSLTLSANVSDVDPNQGLWLKWYKNGVLIAGATSDNYTFYADFDSAGSYNFTLEAADDFDTVRYSWQITVLNVNRAPVITQYNPPGNTIYTDENVSKTFMVTANDPDGNVINVSWTLDGKFVSSAFTYVYQPSYADAGNHELLVTITDGWLSAEKRWTIVVQDINRPPEVLSAIPVNTTISLIEGENETFYVESYDPDGMQIGINWTLDEEIVAQGNAYTYATNWTSAGIHVLAAVITDGAKTTTMTWLVTVADRNRAPHAMISSPANNMKFLTTDALSFNSGGTIDEDGDALSYMWYDGEELLSLEPNFTRSLPLGMHVIKLNVTDGKGGFAETQATVFIRSISLKVTDIIFGSARPVIGKPLMISAIISNAGDTDADMMDVALYVDGVLLETMHNPTIVPAKGNATVNFNWTVQKGVHTVRIELKDNDAMNDLDKVIRSYSAPTAGQTPGFELVLVLLAVCLVALLRKVN